MGKTTARVLAIGAGALTVTMILGRSGTARRCMRRGVNLVARRARYARGRLEGMRYRITGRTPDPWVADDLLADRIRSTLGPLEKRLDLPRVHVMVDDHVAVLHGEVAEPHDAARIERAVSDIAGVRGVESYLHIGLSSGNTRPSEGRAQARALPSPALRELVDAAVAAGAPEDDARRSVRAVLATFADRIPARERDQLLAHLPQDVRELAAAPRREGAPVTRLRSVPQLVAAFCSHDGIEVETAESVTRAVLGILRRLVPEEADDVAAVLPGELRDLWVATVPSS